MMPEIRIIVNDGTQKFTGKSKLYSSLDPDRAHFYLNHPQRGRAKCYIEKDNTITARKRPLRRTTPFIIGAVLYEYGKPVAMIDRNLDKVYPPIK